MSRAALNRSLRQRQKDGTLELSADPFSILIGIEPQEEASGDRGLRIHGSERTFNIEEVLASSIVSHEYFRFTLLDFTTLDEWLVEADRVVTHVQPFEPGMDRKTPSRAFCLVFLLGVMRVTRQQLIHRILGHKTNLFIRALGCLYLRYCWAPGDLLQWYEPILSSEWSSSGDISDIKPTDNIIPPLSSSFPSFSFRPWGGNFPPMLFSKWLKGLVTEFHYGPQGYPDTFFPRIPITTQREMGVRIELLERDFLRAKQHISEGKIERFIEGVGVSARYSEDGRMYPAVICKCIGPNDEDGNGKSITYLVKYDGFEGEEASEIRELGHLDELDSQRREKGRKRPRKNGDKDDQGEIEEDEVDEIRRTILDRERRKAVGGWREKKGSLPNKRYDDEEGRVPKTFVPQVTSTVESNKVDSGPSSVVIVSAESVLLTSNPTSTAAPAPYVPPPAFLALLARYTGGSSSAETGPEEAKRDKDNVKRHCEDVLITEDILPAHG